MTSAPEGNWIMGQPMLRKVIQLLECQSYRYCLRGMKHLKKKPTCTLTLIYVWINYHVLFSYSVMSYSATPWTAAYQASLSITISWSLLKIMSIELVMPSNHLILSSPSSAFNLSQHQGLFKWVSSSHQVAKVSVLLESKRKTEVSFDLISVWEMVVFQNL